ncbi:MAG: lamin tail domain-containing protein [Bacteroidales bacterium]|nr:lamin tail domain-containing protein [Bacteroidales bacterium]
MKKLCLFFSWIPLFVSAQVHFTFEDSTLNLWQQFPPGRWIVTGEQPLSGNYSLRHGYDNPEPGCDRIAFFHDAVQFSEPFMCTFRIRHAYPPSSMNHWQIAFFASMDPNPPEAEALPDGIYFGVNLEGSDDLLTLSKVSGGTGEELIKTEINYQEDIGIQRAPCFRLIRFSDGSWEILYHPDGDEQKMVRAGMSKPAGTPEGRTLLVRYSYSSSQDRKLWLDDLRIAGSFVEDRSPPVVVSVLPGLNDLDIEFNEPVRLGSGSAFILNDLQTASMVKLVQKHLFLSFEHLFQNREKQLLCIRNVEDADGNILQDTTVTFVPNRAEWGDMVISEIMADPLPAVFLPECEYIELFNRSGWYLFTGGWNLDVNGKQVTLPEDSVPPDSYLVVTHHECIYLFEKMGIPAVAGLSSPTAVTNSGGTIALFDQFGHLVHVVKYGLDTGTNGWKAEGGWSLEMIDPAYICGNGLNRDYSEDPSGGTPGRPNSISRKIEDDVPPEVVYTGVADERILTVHFSELLDRTRSDIGGLIIDPGSYHPDSIQFTHPYFSGIRMFLPAGVLTTRPVILHLEDVADCEGNQLDRNELKLGIPTLPSYRSLIISEVMYDPSEGLPEFVEVFNHTGRFLDLAHIKIGFSEDETLPERFTMLSSESRLMGPGEYVVLTGSGSALRDHYNLKASKIWVVPDGLPPLVNSGGSLYLYSRSGDLLDYMSYRDEMHLSILNGTRGVSLERISALQPGNDPANWHSASSTSNYATPGEKNSQSESGLTPEGVLYLSPEVFSPDNDGFEDLLQVQVNPGSPGFVLQMDIIDLSGRRIKMLSNNDLPGTGEDYFWDGRNDTGMMAGEGIYILHAVLYHPEHHKTLRFRKPFALIYR